jgi:aspartate carbamoyltransferase regulatory subunit
LLEITSIKNGLVIDHIEAGMGIKIFNYLNLDKTDDRVALIINAESKQLGKKDIIKIEKKDCNEIDYTVLGLLSPSITIDEVKDERIVKKIKPELPSHVENILICKNPRCITGVEKYVPHSFKLMNAEKGTYRCEYCDEITKLSEV